MYLIYLPTERLKIGKDDFEAVTETIVSENLDKPHHIPQTNVNKNYKGISFKRLIYYDIINIHSMNILYIV